MVDAPAIRLNALTKTFGAVTAVDSVSLDIAAGEFFSMLGPSGSGKTTVLRLIAGFDAPTSGSVTLFGKDVTSSAPFDRDVNTVFQDYALFPHMTVLDNVAYGLRIRGVKKDERRERARAAAKSTQPARARIARARSSGRGGVGAASSEGGPHRRRQPRRRLLRWRRLVRRRRRWLSQWQPIAR